MKFFIFLALLVTATAAFANTGYGTFYEANNRAYGCYGIDNYGRRLVHSRVDRSVCTAGYNTFYVSNLGAYACYPVDNLGRRLSGGRVHNSYCQAGLNSPYDNRRDDRYDDRYDRRDDRREERRHRRDRRDDCGIDEFGRPIYNGYYNC